MEAQLSQATDPALRGFELGISFGMYLCRFRYLPTIHMQISLRTSFCVPYSIHVGLCGQSRPFSRQAIHAYHTCTCRTGHHREIEQLWLTGLRYRRAKYKSYVSRWGRGSWWPGPAVKRDPQVLERSRLSRLRITTWTRKGG